MESWVWQTMLLGGTLLLVMVNGFFVAAEFALVKVRGSKLTEQQQLKLPFAGAAQWVHQRLERSLAACQLGITMASLGLGWIGEPALARLVEPLFEAVGVSAPAVIHGCAFAIAFAIITAAHLVMGEQAPKIYAIRRPARTARWCAIPLKWFYFMTYPFLAGLSWTTALILRRVGIHSISEHDTPHSEEEIRALLSQAHAHGELTWTERTLLDAVFEFDNMICRQIMVPRVEVAYIDVNKPVDDALVEVRTSKHTRYPVCDGSLDKILGFLHVKDLLQVPDVRTADLKSLCRPPRYVPESMPLNRLLSIFRSSRQHLAFVVDEYGTLAGIVTLENVLERIVGSLQDEFDDETPLVVPQEAGQYIVAGGAHVEDVNKKLDTRFGAPGVETMAGLLMERAGRIVTSGDLVELEGATAEVLETKHSRATRIRLRLDSPDEAREQSGG